MTLTDKKIESVIDLSGDKISADVTHTLWREWGVQAEPRCTLTATVVKSTGSGYIVMEITDQGTDRLRFRVIFHVWPSDEGVQDEFKVTSRFGKGTTLRFKAVLGDYAMRGHSSEGLSAKIRCTTERI